ncbi:MAG: thioredoxin domain-containing protein [Candidatus Dormibacteria bacterium]
MALTAPVIDATDATFDTDVIAGSRDRPVVVDFWAGWCAPCRTLGPILEEAVTRHGGITLAKLDVDANPMTAARFGIRGIPAVKGFRDGGMVAEFVGLQPRPQIERFLAGLAPAPPPPPLPRDEAGLRAALLAQPDDPAPRRVLGTLLFEAGRLAEAEEVLAPGRDDPVCDGLRARIELSRGGDPELAALVRDGQGTEGLRRLIAAIRRSGGPERARLRRVVLGGIEDERQADPMVEDLRGELASALF